MDLVRALLLLTATAERGEWRGTSEDGPFLPAEVGVLIRGEGIATTDWSVVLDDGDLGEGGAGGGRGEGRDGAAPGGGAVGGYQTTTGRVGSSRVGSSWAREGEAVYVWRRARRASTTRASARENHLKEMGRTSFRFEQEEWKGRVKG